METIRLRYAYAMRRLYWACIILCVVAVVCMTGLIFAGVIMRYVFDMGARFAEPMSIFFAVQLTMYGAAACFRAHVHLRLQVFVKMLPEILQIWADRLVLVLMAGIAGCMIYYGLSLTQTTWFQAYPEFDYVRVGFVYSAIPGSGLVTLLFIVEAAVFPPALDDEDEELLRAVEHAEEEERTLSLG
jgi:TRAP-type C4-dicarboxylate transport system permease small subunit